MKKQYYISFNIFLKFFKYKKFVKDDNFKVWCRSSTILPIMVDSIVYIYNGKKFIPLYISELMIGHKFGEFVFTRSFKGHTNKNENEKEKKKNNMKKIKMKQ